MGGRGTPAKREWCAGGSFLGDFWGIVWGQEAVCFNSTVIDESGFPAPWLDIPVQANSSPFGPVVGERKACPVDPRLSLNGHQIASVALEASHLT